MSNKKIKVVITMGDPAGIGPEVTIKALTRRKDRRVCFFVAGDLRILQNAAKAAGLDRVLKRPDVKIIDLNNVAKKDFCFGRASAGCGRASVEYIDAAAGLLKKGAADALVTAPICKEAASSSGFKWPGHTEYLAYLSGTKAFCMMLAGGSLRVVPVTRHIALRDVAGELDSRKIYEAIILTYEGLKKRFGVKRPRIAVCALNPHSGEAGLFGKEEKSVIMPAIEMAKAKAAGITGPLAADAVFYDACRGAFDAEIVMYHDQGLIPLKMTARDKAVNITLGLPFIRTSPAHGTAFDKAGKNKANPSSMAEAIRLACQLAAR